MSVQSQQINLYQSAFRKSKVSLTAPHALRLTGVLAIALAAVSGFTHYETVALEKTVASAAQQSKKLNREAEKYNELARQANSEDSVDLVLELKTVRNQRQRVLSNLNAQNEHNNRLFSSYFEGLARRTLDGLWLNRVNIADGGKSVSLAGSTYRAELIPALVGALKQEPAFHGVTFQQASISRQSPDTDANLLTFSLVTNPDESFGEKP